MALRSQSIASPGRELVSPAFETVSRCKVISVCGKPEDPPKSRIYTNNEGSYELGAKLGSGAVS